eukprot:UN14848
MNDQNYKKEVNNFEITKARIETEKENLSIQAGDLDLRKKKILRDEKSLKADMVEFHRDKENFET